MNIVAMQHAFASEALMIFRMVGDVILMRQQHPRDAAHRLDVLHERAGKTRRIDEHIAVVTSNEIADRAE